MSVGSAIGVGVAGIGHAHCSPSKHVRSRHTLTGATKLDPRTPHILVGLGVGFVGVGVGSRGHHPPAGSGGRQRGFESRQLGRGTHVGLGVSVGSGVSVGHACQLGS